MNMSYPGCRSDPRRLPHFLAAATRLRQKHLAIAGPCQPASTTISKNHQKFDERR
jgi:hypothetical protein